MKTFEIFENGQKVKARAEVVKNKIWVHLSGQTMVFDLETGRVNKRSTNQKTSNPHLIMAPMPGKITKIFVVQGQAIKVGDSLIVMEAMKMEYTLKTSIAGKIKKVNCQVNEQVPLATLLVEIED